MELNISTEYENLVPRMTPDEYEQLKQDIQQNGLDRPIVVTQDYKVVDGHHRYKICVELNRLPLPADKVEVKTFTSKLDEQIYVIKSAIYRRQLDSYEKGHLLEKLRRLEAEKNPPPQLTEQGRQSIVESNKQPNHKRNLDTIVKDTQKTLLENSSGSTESVSPPKKKDNRKRKRKPEEVESKTRKLSKRLSISPETAKKVKYVDEMEAKYPDKKIETGQYKNRTYTQLMEELRKRAVSLAAVYRTFQRDRELVEARAETEKLARGLKLSDKVTLFNLDTKKITNEQVKDESVDLIITDPPYLNETLHTFKTLARFASEKLKPGGSLVFFFGQYKLPEIINMFKPYKKSLTYWWTFAVLHESNNSSVFHTRGVKVQWKPMLWFVKGKERTINRQLGDLIQSSKPDKKTHHWAQSSVEAKYIIENLTISEHSLVVDPFLGSGAFAIPAVKLGRYFVGVELDKEVFDRAKNYITKETA